MRTRTRNRRTLSFAALMLAAGMALAQPAAAQLLFVWGGQEKPNDSGRLVGQFDPSVKPGEIIVSFTDRRLYLVTQPGHAISYPIAIPREQDRWEGRTSVTQKRENPSWTPTPTMIKENPKLPRWVPGGHPMNPLGVRALYLGSSLYRIHGTDAPWTIGTAVSKGCIRMYNKDSQDLYEQVKVGAKVLVTWNTYKFTPAPGQPQLPQPPQNDPPAQAQAAPAQVSATANTAAAAEPPVRRAPANFANPFDSDGPQIPVRRSRAERERAEQAELEAQAAAPSTAVAPPAQAAPTKSARAREAAPARDAAPERSRPATTQVKAGEREAPADFEARRKSAPVETGSLGEQRRPSQSRAQAKAQEQAKAKAAAKSKDEAQPKDEVQPSEQIAAQGTMPSPPDTSAADVAARALVAAERAAAAAERAAAAAERAERAQAAAKSDAPAPAAPAAAPTANEASND